MASSPKDLDRRGAILSAALDCFGDVGVEAATIGEICERSGASVGSVYHHFGNKQGIVNALIVAGLRDNLAAIRGQLRGAESAREGVTALVTGLLDWVAANTAWARFIYLRTAIPTAAVAPAMAEVMEEWTAVVGTAWADWVATGEVRDLEPEHVAPMLLGATHDLARRWLGGQLGGDLADHAPAFAAAAWRTVGGDR